jgi:basic membrane lipoprotein Med (substrate-binding protein (PBP1-ABC) superfamily)
MNRRCPAYDAVMRCITFLLLGCFITAGCDRGGSPAPAGQFRVAMILPGSDTDQGWNQLAREGLDRIARELGADTKLVTNIKTSDYATQIDYFAGEGFDVVICHGYEFGSKVAEAAPRYPGVAFIIGGYPGDIPGAASIEFLLKDASHLVGAVAAQVSRTRTVAFVGATPVPTVTACYDGMKQGVESVKGAGVNLLPAQWTNNWDAPQLAKEKAEAAIRGGADVVYQNVDAAARGVFEAAKDASKPDRPVYAFGCNRNQNSLAPDVILGSVVIDVPRAYLELAKQTKEGRKPAGAIKLGLPGGYVDLVLNEQHAALTAAVKQSVNAERQRLVAGK